MTNDPGVLTGDEVVELARHVAGLAGAGLPLPAGLRAAGAELPAGHLRRAAEELAGRLEEGLSLEKALEAPGGFVPAHLRALVLAGVRAGRLGEVLNRFVDHERDAAELRRRLWLSLAYPLILLAALAALFVFVARVIVRDYEGIMRDFGIDLPKITVGLLKVSHVIDAAGWGLVLAPAAAAALVWWGGRGLLSAPWRRRFDCSVPLVGPLRRWTALAEFCHLLALLLDCRLPLPEALPLAGDASRDADLADEARRVARAVEAGAPLAQSFTRHRLLPGGFARLLDWAEGQQCLAEALRMVGDTFAARARAQAALVGVVCLVLAVVTVIWGIAFILLGLYVPLIRLISVLSG